MARICQSAYAEVYDWFGQGTKIRFLIRAVTNATLWSTSLGLT